MFVDLINNAALLITLSVFYGVLVRIRKGNPEMFKLLTGLWFGIITIAGMMMPFVYEPGAIFDGRSVVLSLAGLFGGGISAIISILIAGAYRTYIGGPGMWAGLATIVFCTLTGLIFRKYYERRPERINLLSLLGIGVLVHIIMLLCQLLFPWPTGLTILRLIWLPVMLVFPLAFVFMSYLLGSEEKRFYALQAIKEAESLYRATIYSIGDAVITTNNSGKIKQMNPEAERVTGWKEADADGKSFEDVFRIISEITREPSESPTKKVLNLGTIVGLANHTLLLSKDGREIPIADSGAPIIDADGKIAGVVIVFRDQSDERSKQKLIEKSEAKYRELVETTDAIAWEYNIVLEKWTYVAPQVMDKLGWLPEEWTDLDFWMGLIHPEDREKASQYFGDAVSKQESNTLEYRIMTKKGEFHWIRDVLSVEVLENRPLKIRGIMLDITDRKKFEIELKEKNNFIQTVLDYLPIGLAMNKIDAGNAFYMNRKFEEIYGWNAAEINNIQSFFEKIYPDKVYREEILSRILSDINSGNPEKLHWEDINITRMDGSKGIVNAVNIPLFDQNIMVSTVMDVTRQKEAERSLRESEEQFRKLFENHSVVHLLINPDTGNIVNANQAAADFYGFSIEQLKEMSINHINTLSPEEIQETIRTTRNSGKGYYEFQHRLANGSIRDVEVFTSIVEIKKQDYLFSIVHDITEKKELFSEVVKAKEKAEESDRLKSAFLANMSHEIRTPLNGILGFTGLLTEDDDLSKSEREKYSMIINRSAECLMEIINDILDLSRLETDQLTLNKVNFNLNDSLTGLYTLFQKKLNEKCKNNIDLKLLCPSNKILLNNDVNRLNQIFINLLDNAIKFTNEGCITFGISEIQEGKITFIVSDTGIGIAKEKLSIIFDRFVQAEEDTSKTYGGTGLGLSIVKKLIKIMEGEILVASERGKGTTFTFHLPYNIELQTSSYKPKQTEHRYKNKSLDVLLVEDDSTNIMYYQEIFNRQNIKLRIAENGKDALLKFRASRPDVILMDIRLPDMSGLDVVKEIRKTDQKVRIIAQTAFAMPGDEIKAIESGCNDYMAKPINSSLLIKKLFN